MANAFGDFKKGSLSSMVLKIQAHSFTLHWTGLYFIQNIFKEAINLFHVLVRCVLKRKTHKKSAANSKKQQQQTNN